MNQKGQAVVEATIILSISCSLLFLILRWGLHTQLEMYVDELSERTLICFYQNQTNCTSSLYQRLQKFKFSKIRIQANTQSKTKTLYLSARSPFGFDLENRNSLSLDLQD